MLLHKLIHPIVAASAIPIKILVFCVNCQGKKMKEKKENDDYKIILGIIINHYLRIWSFLPNPDFKQFLLAFYNSLTFLKAAYSESSKSLIVQNLKVTIVNKFFGT